MSAEFIHDSIMALHEIVDNITDCSQLQVSNDYYNTLLNLSLLECVEALSQSFKTTYYGQTQYTIT